MALTKLENLINPQVMADMISGKIDKMIVVVPFAKVDTTLQGRPGNTITVPKYDYIGDAEEVAEGVEVTASQLTAKPQEVTVKKIMKAVELSDEALLSAYGNPQGEATSQIAKAIASKVDADAMAELTDPTKVTLKYTGGDVISYIAIVNAVDVFQEEFNSEKALFIPPALVTVLRKDPDFISADKYDNKVMMTGEIGKVANCRVVSTRKIEADADGNYLCPIIKLNNDTESEDDTPAITIYRKRDVNLETERYTAKRTTLVSADEFYAVAVSNASKCLLATFRATASA